MESSLIFGRQFGLSLIVYGLLTSRERVWACSSQDFGSSDKLGPGIDFP
jgi:hypothetical protein